MSKTSKTYRAWFYRQRSSAPLQCSFVATSADVFDWASVPTKTEKSLRNFQRPEIASHVDEIKEYFKNYAENCSPSSIVVGFRKAPVCQSVKGEALVPEAISPGGLIEGSITIEYLDDSALSDIERRHVLQQMLVDEIADTKSLLFKTPEPAPQTDEELAEADPEDEVEGGSDADGDDDAGGQDDGEAESEGEDEDSAIVTSEVDEDKTIQERREYLARLEEISTDSLPESEVKEYFKLLHEVRKPGLIIDGQHRVRGTKDSSILFSVTALPTASWPELAFQFIVLNKAARKVPDSLLINIVGNSLSPLELGEIEKRLNDSGIPVALYQGVMKLHEDPESPFYGRLRFGVAGESGIIDAAAAKSKIVNFWFRCKLYTLVKHLLPGKTKGERILHWQASGLWYEYLKCFWNTGKAYYESNSSLWDATLEADGKSPRSRLMRVTIINLTQEAFIEHMSKILTDAIKNDPLHAVTMSKQLPDLAAFKTFATMYFDRLKPEFFQDWGTSAKGFDGSRAIRDSYKEAVKAVIGATKTIPELKDKTAPHLLYK